jgi:membrane-bound serine protease (ClpP class)
VITLVALIVAVLFVPSPWSYVLVIAAAIVDLGETGAFVWWSRRRRRRTRPAVGAEDLVGRVGVALSALDPAGQVRVQGEIWDARSATRIDRGGAVIVEAVDGLRLEVGPTRDDADA